MGCTQCKCCFTCPSPDADPDETQQLNADPTQATVDISAYTPLEIADVPSHALHLVYSVLTRPGFYPESPNKPNQDSYCITTQIQGNPNVHFFGVFDGHGTYGALCSSFVKDRVVEILSNDTALLDDPVRAYNDAFLATNADLRNSDINDSMSGTTAITVLVIGNKLYVANVGDSRAVLGVKGDNGSVVAQELSSDQTPYRRDECERVKAAGARVFSVEQLEGIKDPGIEWWREEDGVGADPPRLWVPNGPYPGTAFTRSVGDGTAENIGVVADPEVVVVELVTTTHPFFVIASDGVFEFLSSQAVVDMVNACDDPRDACFNIVEESYKVWLQHENRTDDITIIVVQIKDTTIDATAE